MTSPGDNPWLTFPPRLLRRSALRHIYRHPWQMALNFIGIGLGVMMVVAIDLASDSARRALDIAVERVNGNITHQIVGGSTGVPNEVYTRLRRELGIRRSAPTISGEVTVDGTPFTLLGLDTFSEISLQRRRPGLLDGRNASPDNATILALMSGESILMSRDAARTAGFSAGRTLQLSAADTSASTATAVTLRTIDAGADGATTEGLLYADIGLAQRLLRPEGTLDSIDLILEDSQRERIRRWLPDNLSLVEAQSRHATLDHMSRAFRINLLAMSLLSLLVAALLIYNSVTLSVLQREKTLGIIRSQGVSRAQIFCLVVGEAALLGLVASLVGLLLGYHLGQALLDLVVQGLPASGFDTGVESFLANPWALLKGFTLGLGMTVLSAALPARQATQAAPASLQHHRAHSQRHHHLRTLCLTGIVMMLSGVSLLLLSSNSLVIGFVALTLLVFGFCFLVPVVMNLVLASILSLLGSRIRLTTRMALRAVRNGIRRTGLAVAALTVALSVSVGVGVMVESFRTTVAVWLTQSFSGDIEITGEGLSRGLAGELSELPGAARVNTSIDRQVESAAGALRLLVRDQPAQDSYYLKQINERQLARFSAGEGILVSEPLAWQQQLTVGDSLTLITDRGASALPIVGIFHDYTPGPGAVGIHQALYQLLWDDQTPSRLTVMGDDNPDQAALLSAVRQHLEEHPQLRAFPNQRIRDMTLSIFDRTFAITGVLRILAIVVAFIGVLSALMALLLERAREFATLRATGMTPRQIRRLVLGQSLLMGLFAGLLSLPLGLLMSDVLINVINQRSFGWSMQQTLPLPVLGDAVLLAVAAALLAGLYPAFRAGAISPAMALREE